VNRDGATDWSPSVAANGNLYFGTVRPEGRGGNDLYVARWTEGHYAEPENLEDSLNTRAEEYEPWTSPDERYLIFSAVGRPAGEGGFRSLRERAAGRGVAARSSPEVDQHRQGRVQSEREPGRSVPLLQQYPGSARLDPAQGPGLSGDAAPAHGDRERSRGHLPDPLRDLGIPADR
jgi:hypothetical protein